MYPNRIDVIVGHPAAMHVSDWAWGDTSVDQFVPYFASAPRAAAPNVGGGDRSGRGPGGQIIHVT